MEQTRLGELPMLSLKHVPLEMLSTGMSKLGRPTNIENSNISTHTPLLPMTNAEKDGTAKMWLLILVVHARFC